MWRGYVLVDLRQATEAERAAVLAALPELGAQDHSQPSCRPHGRVSLDGSMLLVEGLLGEAGITALGEQWAVTRFGEAGNYAESHAAVLAYLREHRAAWEPQEP